MRQPAGRAQRQGGSPRKPREQRWAELIEAATRVFFEKGYEAASLQDIAERLGMLKGSLYYYIHSKADLLHDVLSEAHQEALANVDSLANSEGDALERLRDAITGHVEHQCNNIAATTVLVHELHALPAERRAELTGGEHAYQGVFTDLISDGRRQGLIREDVDPEIGALWLLGSLNWVHRWFDPTGQLSPRQIGEQFAGMTLRGIADPAVLDRIGKPEATGPRGNKRRR